jgi:hypothetical protein
MDELWSGVNIEGGVFFIIIFIQRYYCPATKTVENFPLFYAEK